MLDALGVLVARPMSAIKTVQYGTVNLPGGGAFSATATITAVTIGKAVLIMLGWTSSNPSAPVASNFPRIALTNATTVTASCEVALTGPSVTVGFVCVEFW